MPASGPALTKIEETLREERDALARLLEIRARLADAIAHGVAGGVGFSTVARVSFAVKAGRSPTLRERLREARRLKQVTSRHRKTSACPARPALNLGFACSLVGLCREIRACA